jgi:hypothetical protein
MDQGHELLFMVLQALKFHPSKKDNAIAECLEIQFTHDLCDENHEWRVEFKLYSKP